VIVVRSGVDMRHSIIKKNQNSPAPFALGSRGLSRVAKDVPSELFLLPLIIVALLFEVISLIKTGTIDIIRTLVGAMSFIICNVVALLGVMYNYIKRMTPIIYLMPVIIKEL